MSIVLGVLAAEAFVLEVNAQVTVTWRNHPIEAASGITVEGGFPAYIEENTIVLAIDKHCIDASLGSSGTPLRFDIRVVASADHGFDAEADLHIRTDVSSNTPGVPCASSCVDVGGILELSPAIGKERQDGILRAKLFALWCVRGEFKPQTMEAIILLKELGIRSPEIWSHLFTKNDTTNALRQVTYQNKATGVSVGWLDAGSRRNGVWKHFDPSGNLLVQETYEDGVRNGPWVAWGNQPKREFVLVGYFVNDLRHGPWLTQSDDRDNLKTIQHYERGLLSGDYREYDSNGVTLCRGQYKNGQPIEKWTWWTNEGKMLETKQF